MKVVVLPVFALIASLGNVSSFSMMAQHKPVVSSLMSSGKPTVKLTMVSTVSSSTEEAKQSLLQSDRYIATNRFAVRKGKEARFEQRWATRKSRLSTLDGFKYFHLMRRVSLDGNTSSTEDDTFGNYVSFTVWSEKNYFTSWRKGDAFKEAHGGTSIGAFVSTLVNSALVLEGPPRPAFYDGLLALSMVPESVPETQDGWRTIEANGKDLLPVECFVACNQFYITEGNREAFEQRWANREVKLKDCDGFVAFFMLRRDGTQKGHGIVDIKENEPTYMSTTIWRDRAAFDSWRTGQAFKEAHGGAKPSESSAQPPKPLWTRPPSPVFYEGTLVITSPEGA